MSGVVAPLGLITYKGFKAIPNRLFKTAELVVEVITKSDLEKPIISRKDVRFHEDEKISALARARLSDYKNSGFTRGHLVAAAHARSSLERMEDTFCLTNITPQLFEFNSGYWSKLEEWGRKQTNYYDQVHIFSGPLYIPEEGYLKIQVIGANHVAVPTHFFKVFVLFKAPIKFKMYSFMPPHKPLKGIPIQRFQCSLRQVEEASGFEFFVNGDPFFQPLLTHKFLIEHL